MRTALSLLSVALLTCSPVRADILYLKYFIFEVGDSFADADLVSGFPADCGMAIKYSNSGLLAGVEGVERGALDRCRYSSPRWQETPGWASSPTT